MSIVELSQEAPEVKENGKDEMNMEHLIDKLEANTLKPTTRTKNLGK